MRRIADEDHINSPVCTRHIFTLYMESSRQEHRQMTPAKMCCAALSMTPQAIAMKVDQNMHFLRLRQFTRSQQ
jgi:hypothetical protein